jgi:hypothetical protein
MISAATTTVNMFWNIATTTVNMFWNMLNRDALTRAWPRMTSAVDMLAAPYVNFNINCFRNEATLCNSTGPRAS